MIAGNALKELEIEKWKEGDCIRKLFT
jgi:hypothetical protein